MRKLFAGPVIVVPAVAVSAHCEGTGLKVDIIQIRRTARVCSHDRSLRSRSPQWSIRTDYSSIDPGQSRPGRSQLPAMQAVSP